MKKVITSDDIKRARKSGHTSLTLAPGDLITPQARDDAREYGIQIIKAAGAQAALGMPAVQSGQCRVSGASWPRPARITERPSTGVPGTEAVTSTTVEATGTTGISGPVERFRAASERAVADERRRATEEAVRRIAGRMSFERCRMPEPCGHPVQNAGQNQGQDAGREAGRAFGQNQGRQPDDYSTKHSVQTIGSRGVDGGGSSAMTIPANLESPVDRQAIAPYVLQTAAAPAGIYADNARCEKHPDIETEKLVSVIMEVISEFYPGYSGHLSRLQAQTEPGTVRICESSSGGVPFSLLSWDGKPLEWLFEAPERLSVIEGRLLVRSGSGAFELVAGEFKDMPAGTRVSLTAEGPVSCKLASCA